jgi:hypothetical protein
MLYLPAIPEDGEIFFNVHIIQPNQKKAHTMYELFLWRTRKDLSGLNPLFALFFLIPF